MSHSWVYNLIEKLYNDAKRKMFHNTLRYAFAATHDNLNLAFKVYKQRRNSQSTFDSGTTATVYIFKDANIVWPRHPARTPIKNPITATEIMKLELAAVPHLCIQAINRVLKFLTNLPDFDFENYRFNDKVIFVPPPPVFQLPTGKDHAVCQYVMDTVHQESASQEGTRRCLDEWMKQLHLNGPQAHNHPTHNHTLVWIGDQLTTVRIHSVKKNRSENNNFLQCLEQFVEIFGWFLTRRQGST
ncbi:hypothetical protein BC835DRAFT_1431905 [Cytidiella melzeri]|nr:hypothetical protein BC835DRAFT_1431905 [Cytidiella melzeri]